MIFLNLIFEIQSNSKTTAKNPKRYFISFSRYLENSVPILRLKKPRDTKRFVFLHFVPVTSVVVILLWQHGRTVWRRKHARHFRRFKHHLLVVNIPRKWFRRKMSTPWNYTISVWALSKQCKERKRFSGPRKKRNEDGLKMPNENASDKASNRLSSRDWKVQDS